MGGMENLLTRKIYDHSPVWLQHLYATAFGLHKRWMRFGRKQREYDDFFTRAATWSRAELQAFQDEKVREVVRLAYEHVPFHRWRMDALGLKPGDIRGVADLPKLPLLEKSEVREAGDDMLSTAIPRSKILSAVTSGSTGFPMKACWTREALEREYSFHWARRRLGVERGDSYGSFTGLQLVPAGRLTPPFWRYNWAAGQTCYSIFHLTPETIPLYLEEMQRRRHVFYEGYPSVVAMLGKAVLDTGLDWPCPPRAMFTEAEQLQDEHRRWIEQGFRTHVYNQYGQCEKASSITEYDCGHLHYDMDYSVIEFLPVDREEGGTVAEIVCTAFDNPAYPLIRYRIGDLALLPDVPPACPSRASPTVLAISGRTGHSLLTRDGRRINNISVILKRCHHIEMAQCVQTEPGEVEVRILRSPGYTAEDEKNLLFQFGQKMGAMEFRLVYVDSPQQFERTRRGKFLSIISKLPR
jgi:phenylacetate-CoA ligase